MNAPTPSIMVKYYDGQTNLAHSARLSREHNASTIVVEYQQHRITYTLQEIQYIPSVGQVLAAIDLPNHARIEFLDEHIPDWLELKHHTLFKKVNALERNWKWIFCSFIAVLAVVFSTVKWGIPSTAHFISQRLPATTLYSIGSQAEQAIVDMTEKTELTPQRQQQIISLFNTLDFSYFQHLEQTKPKLLFRKGLNIGANALAIPNNTIVITDELVELAKNDDEILAVLAHEVGHLTHRHSLQQSLQGLGISLLFLAVTGDSSDLLQTIPILLVSAQYSQKFELEADLYAIQQLQQLQHSPTHLANFLQRLDELDTDTHQLQILNSHPSTKERVQQVLKHTH